MSPFDVCIVGHLSRDRIVIGARIERTTPGGAAFYASMTYARLGLRVCVVTKTHRSDEEWLIGPLRENGIEVRWSESLATTTFENIYLDAALNERRQRVHSVADPLRSRDMAGVQAAVYHFGPIIAGDLDPAVWRTAVREGDWVVLDVQGLVRNVVDGNVRVQDWPEKADRLVGVDVVKADLSEATTLTGATDAEEAARTLPTYGPKEVIVTSGDRGSVILSGGVLHRIPCYPPPVLVDATGCGDTYLAGYVARRLRGDDPERAGRFAAATASLKLARDGPFTDDASAVEALMMRWPGPTRT